MDDYTAPPEETPPPRPRFLARFWMVFVQPGELFRALGKNPAWFPMAVFVAVGMAGVTGSYPDEVWEAQMAASGQEVVEGMATVVRIAAAAGTFFVMAFVVPPLISAFTCVVFVFLRGDNATYKQHLSVVSHAGIVMLVGSLVNMPLQVLSGDLETVLSLGTFLPFLSDGFLLAFLNQLQLFLLWTIVVAGIGLASLDERRRAGPTAAILLVTQVILALGCAGFVTAFSPTF